MKLILQMKDSYRKKEKEGALMCQSNRIEDSNNCTKGKEKNIAILPLRR